ncbi:MAG: hypothetical protein J7L44_02055 [Candidatus Diapherotrites archaeon]|nr:hypothetical protein [Candidatus Diapherotrites archaeon]
MPAGRRLRRELRKPAVQPQAKLTPERVREIVRKEMQEVVKKTQDLAERLRKEIAKRPAEVTAVEKPDPLARLELKNVPLHHAQTKAPKKNVRTVHQSWVRGINGDIKSFIRSIDSMQAYVQGLEKALESKTRNRYKNLLKTFFNPLNWLHPIKTYRRSALATRRRLRAARAELQRLLAVKDLWLAVCRQELAVINKYFAMVAENPTKENATIFGNAVTNIAMKHFELRNLTMTMVFGEGYQRQIRAMHKVMGTESGKAPSYVLAGAKKRQLEFVRDVLTSALKELQAM